MPKGRTGKQTITVITTTLTIRWWDGRAWIEQTLRPSVEIIAGDGATSSPTEAASAARPEAQEPPCEPETGHSTLTKEAKP